MSTDYELFKGKNLSSLFEDIYNNQTNKKQQISIVIKEMRDMVRHAGDLAVVGPIIRDLIDTSVKNDETLIKLATIAQRLVISEQKNEGEEGFLTAAEREKLLSEIDEIEEDIEEEVIPEEKVKKAKEKVQVNDVS